MCRCCRPLALGHSEEKLRRSNSGAIQILNNFLNDDSHLVESQFLQAKTYLEAKSFDQAILEARITKESNRKLESEMKDKLNLLIVRCMVEKGKYLDAREILAEEGKQFFI